MNNHAKKLKKAAKKLQKVLDHGGQVRSWLYSEGKTEDDEGGLYGEDAGNFYESLEKLRECDWDIKKFFSLAATEGAAKKNSDIKFVKGWEKVVKKHVNEFNLK